MSKLIEYQFLYFSKLIIKRLELWLGLIVVVMTFISVEFGANPHSSIFNFIFDGTPFSRGEIVELPVVWFFYLICPVLIVANALNVIWEKCEMKLRGLQFKRSTILLINIILMLGLDITYVAVTFLAMVANYKLFCTNRFSLLRLNENKSILFLFLIVALIEFILLLIQQVITLFESTIAIITVISCLIITAYTNFLFNPLNLTMLKRIDAISFERVIQIALGAIMFLIYIYFSWGRKKDFS